MNDLKHAVVMPSFAALGIQSKESRGVLAEQGEVPAMLAPIQTSLQRIASRLGVDLSQTGDALRVSFEKAIAAKPVAMKPSIVREQGLSLG